MALTAIVLGISGAFAQNVVFVDQSASGNDSGADWANAFPDLDTALVSGASEIRVAEGTYIPAGGANPSTSFQLTDGCVVLGGFPSGGAPLEQRDSISYATTLSGASSVYHVVRAQNVGPSTVLDGFTITGGMGDDGGYGGAGGAGGGIYLDHASPTIVECTIQDNHARIGAGVLVFQGSPTFRACSVNNNDTVRSGEGGGIYALSPEGPTSLTIEDCYFGLNTAYQGHFATGHGGAIYSGSGVNLTVKRSTFVSNFTFHNSSLGNATTGGAITNFEDGALFEDCVFLTNYSNLGAGIYSIGSITVHNSLFVGNRAVGAITCGGFDCPSDVPDRNAGFGGGVYCSASGSVVIGSTFADNWAAKRGAGMHMVGILQNSIAWGNRDYQPPGEDPTPLIDAQIHGNVSVEYSDVEALFQTIPGEGPPEPANFPGCLDTDPFFVDPSGGDYRLAENSPCIDAADNSAVPSHILADLEGKPRFMDSPLVDDTGSGVAPIVDMGPYEFLPEGAGNLPPVPRFSYIVDGHTVHFTDTSGDYDGEVIAWQWNFGDGMMSDETNPIHAYVGDGPFTVTLTVWDNETGSSVSDGVEIALATDPMPLHVANIRLRAVPALDKLRVIGKVVVRDANASPIPGASVTGTFTLPNGKKRVRIGVTNANGIAKLRITNQAGTYMLQIDDVVLEGYILDLNASVLSASRTFN
jgi:hypothetical protein